MDKRKLLDSLNRLNNSRGITLLELVIVSGLIVFVLSIAFSLYFFENKSFNNISNQSSLQSNLRATSYFIANEVRNAKVITVTQPTSPSTYNQIYLSNQSIKYQPISGTVVNKTGAIIQNPADLSFSIINVDSKYKLRMTIKGTQDTNTYTVTSEILLNNIKSATEGNSQHLYYIK